MNKSNNDVTKPKGLLSLTDAPVIRPPRMLLNLVEEKHSNANGHSQETRALPRKRSATGSLLSELLADSSASLLPYVLQFDSNDCTYPDEANKYKPKTRMDDGHLKMAKLTIDDLDLAQSQASRAYSDYFVVTFESTRQLEQAGADNSLFLLVARALLYRLNFVDQGYGTVLRTQVFQGLVQEGYRFDSDMSLQELLRKRLCLHWLSFVRNGKFTSDDCKYYK